jgi:hypothetical protein
MKAAVIIGTKILPNLHPIPDDLRTVVRLALYHMTQLEPGHHTLADLWHKVLHQIAVDIRATDRTDKIRQWLWSEPASESDCLSEIENESERRQSHSSVLGTLLLSSKKLPISIDVNISREQK